MKRFLTAKNIIILILLISTVLLSANAIRNYEKQADIDRHFIGNYTNLLMQARSGGLHSDPSDFDEVDVQCVKYGHTLTTLFRYTSYAENEDLGHILAILNQAIGETRFYASVVDFSEIPKEDFQKLLDLMPDFEAEKCEEAWEIVQRIYIQY